jgi:hypothetical protein
MKYLFKLLPSCVLLNFTIFQQRNWENFGFFFGSSGVNSTNFANLLVKFFQNFDAEKMTRRKKKHYFLAFKNQPIVK